MIRMLKSIKKGINFLKECVHEAKSIIWPTPHVISKQFVVVLVLSSLIVLILYSLDIMFASGIQYLKQLVS